MVNILVDFIVKFLHFPLLLYPCSTIPLRRNGNNYILHGIYAKWGKTTSTAQPHLQMTSWVVVVNGLTQSWHMNKIKTWQHMCQIDYA